MAPIVLSILLQTAAATLALAQVRRAGTFRYAWLALSGALLLMVWRRVESLMDVLHDRPVNPTNEVIGLAVSGLLLAGLSGLRSLFVHLDEQRQALAALATTDPLTGVANRRRIFQLADREILRAERSGHPVAVLMIDLDHFKDVNDSFGHAVGDQLLSEVAGTCEKALRQIDAFGRVGGEEFVAVLPETDGEQAMSAAERLRAAVALLPGAPAPITISVGIAVLHPRGDPTARPDPREVADLLARADEALYQAKAAGRNCCRLAAEGGVRGNALVASAE